MPHSKLCFCPNPDAHYVENAKMSDIELAIRKKEAKLPGYRYKTKLQTQWLLIVIGNANPSCFDINEDAIKEQFNIATDFSRIYIFNSLEEKILRLK